MLPSVNQVNTLRTRKGLRLSVFVAIIIFAGFLATTTAHGDIVSNGKYTDISSQNRVALDESSNNGETLKVLVGFRTTPGARERSIINAYNGNIRFEFKNVKAFAIDISAKNLEELARNPEVCYIEEDAPRYALDLADSELEPSLSNGLYGLITTNSTDAHAKGVNGTGVKIGIADTGLDYNHPDIKLRYQNGTDKIDDDDDPYWGNDIRETHGTHVAGTALAALNEEGVRGVAYGADLYYARVLGPTGGSISSVMAGVEYLVNEECKIISLSLGGPSPSRTEEAFYQDLYDNHGTLIIAAAGNDGKSNLIYPAGYPTVLSVGAVDKDNNLADFSNYGDKLDLVAPGVNVLSSVPNGTGSEAEVIVKSTSYPAFGMEFAGKTEVIGINGTVVYCGTGNDLSDFPTNVTGNIALMERGDEYFATKVDNAMSQGAAAAIIYNNVAGDFVGTLMDANNSGVPWIPAVSVNDTTGAALVYEAGENGTVINLVSDWDHYSGTSMATPHVAGVAGLVWSFYPDLDNVRIEYILKNTAYDLGDPGYDENYGNGLVNASHALNFESDSDLCISNVIDKVTSKKAVITWETNVPSDSLIEYGKDSDSLSLETSSSDLVTSHSITLTGLSSSTTYYFQVKSTDDLGNTATDDNNGMLYEFTTSGRRV